MDQLSIRRSRTITGTNGTIDRTVTSLVVLQKSSGGETDAYLVAIITLIRLRIRCSRCSGMSDHLSCMIVLKTSVSNSHLLIGVRCSDEEFLN